jgi:hypothetical protein
LDWMGKVMTIFEMPGPPDIPELRRALQGLGGRRVYVP